MMDTKKFTVQEFMAMQTIGRIQVTNDGAMVVYEQSYRDMDADEGKTDLWWVSTQASSTPQRITSTGKDSAPSWSHTGSQLAFMSSRSGKGQIYILQRSGGEAQCIPTERVPSGVLKWSPDDTHIAFMASVERSIDNARYAGEPENLWQDAARLVQDRAEKAKASGKPATGDGKTPPVRVITDFVHRRDGVGFTYERRLQLFVLNIADGTCVQLSHTEDNLSDFIWLNNDTLIYNTNANVYNTPKSDKDGNYLQTAFARVCHTGEELPFTGTAQHIVGDARSMLVHPSGKGMFYISARELGSMKPPVLVYWDFATDDVQELTADVDRSVGNLHMNSIGDRLWFTVAAQAQTSIWEATWEEDQMKVVSRNTYAHGTYAALSVSETGYAFVRSAPQEMPQLYYHHKNGEEWCLTSLNPEFIASQSFQPVEVLHYPSFDGCDIEGFLMKPLGYQEGTTYPTILSVHGGPTGVYMRGFDATLQMLATEGYAVLFVNPRGSVTYGEQFTRGVFQDWGGKDFQDIMAGVDKAIDIGIADPNRLGITGWSYGGYMTCWGITQTNRFRAAVGGANISNIYNMGGNSAGSAFYDELLMGGAFFDLEEEHMRGSAIRYVRNVNTPLLLLHGELDINCPTDQSEMYYTALKRLGKEVVFVRYPAQYHGLTKPSYIQDRWLRTIGWFDYYLKF